MSFESDWRAWHDERERVAGADYGPSAPAANKSKKDDPYGENYEFWKQGLSPVKVSYTTQLVLAVIVVTIVVTLVLIFA